MAEELATSAACLVIGTRLSMTARAGLEEALATVPTVSIGSAPPYLACTHAHTDDLRGSLRLLTEAVRDRGGPAGPHGSAASRRTELVPRRSPAPVSGTATSCLHLTVH